GDLRLALEPGPALRPVGVGGLDLLQRDLAVELFVAGEKDLAEATAGVQPDDPEPVRRAAPGVRRRASIAVRGRGPGRVRPSGPDRRGAGYHHGPVGGILEPAQDLTDELPDRRVAPGVGVGLAALEIGPVAGDQGVGPVAEAGEAGAVLLGRRALA